MSDNNLSSELTVTSKEKRPQDWTLKERFSFIIKSNGLCEEAISKLCRSQGIFPHHIKEWTEHFIGGTTATKKQQTVKELRNEVKELAKDLNRKNRALAETAALLVLQKKVNTLWGNNEGSLQ